MPKRSTKSGTAPSHLERTGYAVCSRRPLTVLLFLAPLLILYEVGSLLYLTDRSTGVVETISAYSIIGRATETFGVAGFAAPAAVMVVVLLTWHFLARDPWRVRPGTLAGMAVESVAWTLPLLAVAALIGGRAAAEGGALEGGPWQARLTLAVGAGLYEELLFRLLLIPVAVIALRDVIRLEASSARFGAIGLSALLFTLYHDLGTGGAGVDWSRAAFFLVAGVFFGGLFVWRGFGIVVGVHAAYDVVVLLLLGG